MKRYQVVVGNVGHVCDTDQGFNAWTEYRQWVRASKENKGTRAYGEPVTLFRDGEIHAEYYPPAWTTDELIARSNDLTLEDE